MVDKNASQLITDRFVQKDTRHRRIDTARERADHLLVADLFTDARNCFLAIGGHGPIAGETAHLDEVFEHLCAVRRVMHFGVELNSVETAGLIGNHRQWCVRRNADGLEPGGKLGDAVAVAHPDLFAARLE